MQALRLLRALRREGGLGVLLPPLGRLEQVVAGSAAAWIAQAAEIVEASSGEFSVLAAAVQAKSK